MTDTHFDKVTLLLHFDADFSDGLGHSFTNYGAAISNTQSKFGGYSGYFNGSAYINTPYVLNDFGWFLSDFTLEAWVYMAAGSTGSSQPTVISNNTLYTACYWAFGPNQDNKLDLYYYTGSLNHVVGSTTITTGAWHHIAMTHASGTIKLWLDGVCDATASVSGTPLHSTNNPLEIGRSQSYFNGYIDDLRITKGVARYTANFTPPTAAFGSGAGITYVYRAYLPMLGVLPLAPANALDATGVHNINYAQTIGRHDVYFAGTGQIVGTVKEKATPTNLPLSRKVALIDDATRMVIRETWSTAAGDYTFANLDPARSYTAIAWDHTHTYRAIAADGLTTIPM